MAGIGTVEMPYPCHDCRCTRWEPTPGAVGMSTHTARGEEPYIQINLDLFVCAGCGLTLQDSVRDDARLLYGPS